MQCPSVPRFGVLMTGLFSVGMLVSGSLADGEIAKPVRYAGILFDHKSNEVKCEGRISREQFRKWFKEDYDVGGERIETPQDAVSFGVLVLTDGDEIVTMPFYRWGGPKDSYFACQSAEIGKAPMFSVLERTEADFIASARRNLSELSTQNQ